MGTLIIIGFIFYMIYRSEKKRVKREHGISRYTFKDFMNGKWSD